MRIQSELSLRRIYSAIKIHSIRRTICCLRLQGRLKISLLWRG
nr:MAG TPA: hypothetical protein [Caudoviricetes sp.]